MRQLIFLALAVVLFTRSMAQQHTTHIIAKEKHSKKTIENCTVYLYERPIWQNDSVKTLSNWEDKIFLDSVSLASNKNIRIHSTLPFSMLAASCRCADYAPQSISILPKKDSLFIEFSLIKNNESTEINDDDIIRNWLYNKVADELDKANDIMIPETETQKSINATCDYTVPKTVYVKNLYNGYNSTSCSNTGIFTGNMNFDEYIAGVITREMGGSFELEALKAQAVAARTYSIRRHNNGLPVNCGQSYSSTVDTKCTTAAQATSDIVLLYNGSPIDASYSARCAGNYTQHSEEGLWTRPSNCNRSGNVVAYLRSKSCSGHSNCSTTGESLCCTATVSTANTTGYIYGHGVGMCQRGANAFAKTPYNYSWDKIIDNYYTGICNANFTGIKNNNSVINNSLLIVDYSSKEARISILDKEHIVKIEVKNMQGKSIEIYYFNTKISNIKLNFVEYLVGMYCIEISSNTNKYIQKLIVF